MSCLTDKLAAYSAREKRDLLAKLLKIKKPVMEKPLSYGQKAMYFLHLTAPDSAAYHVSFAGRIRSRLDVAAMGRALQALADRHPQLRASFTLRGGEPVQRIAEGQPVAFAHTDASGWSEAQVFEAMRAAYQKPFDLASGRVFRADLFSLAEQEHVLLVTVHHIVYDAWSLWMNQGELAALYATEAAGAKAGLPPTSHSYFDFIDWQNRLLAGPEGSRLWEFWLGNLQGELPTLNLPTDRPRPPAQTFKGASLAFQLDAATTSALKALAQREGATPFMMLLAAYQVLLHRYTGQEDILVGSPAACRNQGEFAGVVGYFVNPLVLRADLSGNPKFTDFLAQAKRTLLAALDHQDFPFPLLVERLQPKRDPSYSPLFQTSFVYQRAQREGAGIVDLIADGQGPKSLDWGGLALEHYDLPQQEGQFDLELEMLESGGELVGVFKYNADLFDASTVGRAAGHYRELLQGVLAEPAARVGELPLLTPGERLQLAAFNDTAVDYDLAPCLHEHFEAQARKTPEAIALVFEGASLSYRELNARANRLARYLRAQGVGPDTLVGVFMERSMEMVVALYGVLKAGGAYVPLDPAFPRERLAFMLEDARFPVVLTQAAHAAALPGSDALVFCLDSQWGEAAALDGADLANLAKPHNLAYVIYTSGSTGRPKGAMNTHQGICNRLLWMQDAYRLGADDHVLQKTPYTFDVSVWEFFWPLMAGARLVVAKPGGHQDSAYLAGLVEREKITTLHFVPPMLQAMLQQEGFGRRASLSRVICSGEALPLDLQRRFFEQVRGIELHNLYGPTEAAIDVTYWACERDGARATVPIGRPIANTQIHILDRWLRPTPVGVPGELHIGGVNVARGYLNRPELTAEKFIDDPFSDAPGARLYKTGDLARYREDGTLEYLGRLDFQVKIRGFRIELGEIEAVLCQHPQVAEALATVVKAPSGDPCLVGYVAGHGGAGVDVDALRRHLQDRLPEYSVPAALVPLERFPLSHNGKVDRKALPEPAAWRGQAEAGLALPQDAYEQGLARIWEETLGVRPVGVRHNFFDLGGHSLLALRLVAQIQREFGVALPASALFQAPTVERLAAVLREQGGFAPWTPLAPIRAEGGKRPFFCVAGGAGSAMYYHPLARLMGQDRPFYGLQAKGLDGESAPYETVEAMAAHYIDAVRTVQPEGPYLLGGHCFGAVVAFEMAQQLARAGQKIERLVMLNVPAPRAEAAAVRCGRDIDDATWVAQLGGLFEQALGQSLGIAREELAALDFDGQLDYLKERLVRAGVLPPDTGIAPVRGLVQVYKANNRTQYVPKDVVPVPVALIRAKTPHPDYDFSAAEQGEGGGADPSLGWRRYALGPVPVAAVEGDHITMMTGAHAAELARALDQALDQAEAPPAQAAEPARRAARPRFQKRAKPPVATPPTRGHQTMLERYSRWLLRWRYAIIPLVLLFSVAAAMGIGSLHFKNNYRMFFSEENPDLKAFDHLQDSYSRSDNVLLVLAPKDGQVFSAKNLALVEEATALAWKIPYSTRVDSLTNFQHSYGQEDQLVVGDLVRDAARMGEADVERVRRAALADPLLVNRLVAADGHATGINMIVQRPGQSPMAETKAVTDALKQLKARLLAEQPDLGIYLTGSVMMDAAFSDASEHDGQTLTPVMLTLIIVGLAWFFRSFAGTLVTVTVISLSIVVALGLAGWLGIALSPSSVPAPTIMLTLAVADSVHLLMAYYDGCRKGLGKHDAMVDSLKNNLSAVFFTSLTTAIGFLSMNFSDAPPFRDLGNITAMGVAAAFILSATLLPTMAVLFPAPKAKADAQKESKGMARFADWVIGSHKSWYLAVLVMTGVLISFVARNELNDEFVKYFATGTDFRQATDFTTDNLTGIYYIDYSLGAGAAGGVADPQFLAKVEEFSNWYRQQPEVLHVYSITDIFKRLHKNLHGDQAEWYRLPETHNLASQYLLLFEMSLPFGLDMNDRVNVDKSATRVTVTLKSLSTNEVLALDGRARDWLAANAPELRNAGGTGLTMMFAHIGARNIASMISGEIMSTVLISFILIFVLRSTTLGLLSLIPNLVPAAMAFGVWGILVGRVGLASSVVAAMTLGILVDDTVHFLGKYQKARREKNLSPEDALRYAFSTVGNAIWVTSAVLMAGFALLALSDFKINSEMGLLTAIIFGLGLFAEFLLLPPLLLQIEALRELLGQRFPRLFPAAAQASNNP